MSSAPKGYPASLFEEIKEKQSKSYTIWKLDINSKISSFSLDKEANHNIESILLENNQYKKIIIKYFDGNRLEAKYKLGNKSLLLQDELPEIKWHITKDKKNIAGFQSIKAEGHYCMFETISKIEAWFTTDIPLSDGPEIFHGLPGLITHVKLEYPEAISTYTLNNANYGSSKVNELFLDQNSSKVYLLEEFCKMKRNHFKKIRKFRKVD